MSNVVTIDNYDVKTHERYAIDQKRLTPELIKDAGLVSPHFEIPDGESSISSKWEELFGTNLHIHPWARFTTPPRYALVHKRYFSYSLSSNFDWIDADEEDEEKQREEEEKLVENYKKKIKAKQSKRIPTAILEKDRMSLLKMIDSIQSLNGFLREIHARKLQYQKG